MIIQHRAARLSYATDSIARDLRSFIAVPARRTPDHAQAAPVAGTPRPLAQLYPALYAPDRSAFPVRATRALAFRLGVIASILTTFAAVHH